MEEIQIMPNELDKISNYRLFVKGNAWIPARFYEYVLICRERNFNEDDLKRRDFYEMDLKTVCDKYHGVKLPVIN